MTVKISYDTNIRDIVTRGDQYVVTYGGCGCCASDSRLNKDELVKAIQSEIESLQALLKELE